MNRKRIGLEGKLIQFAIENDLIPVGIRWKVCATGVGRLFNDLFKIVDDDKRKDLTRMMYEWGVADAEGITKEVKAGKDLHGCAVAVIAMNQIFGIKSHIESERSDEVIIHATECMWKDIRGWTPEVCSSVSAYELGLLDGTNKHMGHSFTKRRSKGDNVCELVLKKS